jgi:hypothetical protein
MQRRDGTRWKHGGQLIVIPVASRCCLVEHRRTRVCVGIHEFTGKRVTVWTARTALNVTSRKLGPADARVFP